MSDSRFATVFVATSVLLGWAWRIAQDFHVPFLIRTAAATASVFLLQAWLKRRLAKVPIQS